MTTRKAAVKLNLYFSCFSFFAGAGTSSNDHTGLRDPGVMAGVIASIAVVIVAVVSGVIFVIITRRIRQLSHRHAPNDPMYETPDNITLSERNKESGLANPMYENPSRSARAGAKNNRVCRECPDNRKNERKEVKYNKMIMKLGERVENRYEVPDI